ncbi:MAG TPA: matrixin family metalloprotease [Chthoniobacterales bacterium]|nr:matrixin family metalloprotease [Chthoniobacterales bacterium]
MSTARLLLLPISLISFCASPVRGFVHETNTVNGSEVPIAWTKNRTVLMHLSLPKDRTQFIDGSASYNAIAESALNIWNQNLVHMKFAVDRNAILPAAGDDANTSVTMSDTVYGEGFGANVLAVTLITPRDDRLVEADVIFNNQIDWDSYRGSMPEGPIDFRRVALHEFGHVVGLDHPDQAKPKQAVTAIMNSIVSNSIDDLQFDDIAGAHAIYDGGPDYQTAAPGPNLVNLSTRAFVGTGNNVVIGGFIIQGSQPTTVVLRGIGYSLPALGIANALEDPVIELHSSTGTILATSDDWIDDSWATSVASYHLDPQNSRESAILTTLDPGSYTVVVRSFDNGNGKLTGIALVELYDLHLNSRIPSSPGRAGNISTRGPVITGDQLLIGGFIVGGNQTKEVAVRAIGPSLAAFGVSGALPDPTVELRDASGNLVDSNNNWGDHPKAAQIQSEGLAPNQPVESALQVTLGPGSYTAIVRGFNGATGIGLVEIYDLSPAPN